MPASRVPETNASNGGAGRRFEVVTEEVFRRYGRRWKPRTLHVNRSYLRNQIGPWFNGRQIGGITRDDVSSWFASLRATPAAANRSLPVLSVIMAQAELYGYRRENSNPCVGIHRYAERSRERHLTPAEVHRLGAALAGHEPVAPCAVAVVRLLLLTGCRQSEIRTLKWSEYREGHLFLRDSKSGPRTVWLSTAARAALDRIPRNGRWVFPAAEKPGPMPTETLYRCWRTLRAAAGIPGVRLHDLRHTYASFALRQGETVLTIGRLLGHRDPSTTLKYVHVADPFVRGAAEAVGAALDAGR